MFTVITLSAIAVTISELILFVANESNVKLNECTSFILRMLIIWSGIALILLGSIGLCIKGNVLMSILGNSHNIYVIEKNNKPTDVYLTYNNKEYHFEINESKE